MEKVRTAIQYIEGAAHTWGARWWEQNQSLVRAFERFTEDFFRRANQNWNESYNIQLAHLY